MKENIHEYYGVASTPTSDFIAHYGVLGMKWGMRRAAKKGTTYEYKSHATKKYEKLAAKLAKKGKMEKSKMMANRAKRSHEIDKGEQEYAKGLSTGKAVAGALLLGGGAMKGYAQNRAISKAKGYDQKGSQVLDALSAGYGGSLRSRERKAGYIRESENRRGLNAGAHKFREGIRSKAADAFGTASYTYNKAKKNYQKQQKRRR